MSIGRGVPIFLFIRMLFLRILRLKLKGYFHAILEIHVL